MIGRLPPAALKRPVELREKSLQRLGLEPRKLDIDIDHRQPKQRDAALAFFRESDLHTSGRTDDRDRSAVDGEGGGRHGMDQRAEELRVGVGSGPHTLDAARVVGGELLAPDGHRELGRPYFSHSRLEPSPRSLPNPSPGAVISAALASASAEPKLSFTPPVTLSSMAPVS